MELLTHNGTTVYRVYKDGEPGITRSFHFSMVNDGDEFGPATFDVRSLPTWQGTGDVFLVTGLYPISPEGDKIHAAIRAAIELGLLPGMRVPPVVDRMGPGAQRLRTRSQFRRLLAGVN